MVPDCGVRNPEIALNKVVLPEPFGPIRPMMPRSGTEKLTLRSTCRPAKLWPTASRRRMSLAVAMRGPRFCHLPPQYFGRADQPALQPHDHADQRQAEQDLVKVAE